MECGICYCRSVGAHEEDIVDTPTSLVEIPSSSLTKKSSTDLSYYISKSEINEIQKVHISPVTINRYVIELYFMWKSDMKMYCMHYIPSLNIAVFLRGLQIFETAPIWMINNFEKLLSYDDLFKFRILVFYGSDSVLPFAVYHTSIYLLDCSLFRR